MSKGPTHRWSEFGVSCHGPFRGLGRDTPVHHCQACESWPALRSLGTAGHLPEDNDSQCPGISGEQGVRASGGDHLLSTALLAVFTLCPEGRHTQFLRCPVATSESQSTQVHPLTVARPAFPWACRNRLTPGLFSYDRVALKTS